MASLISPRLRRAAALPLMALLLSGCAAQMAYREGRELAAQDKIEAALVKLQEAAQRDPTNAQYRTAYFQLRDRHAARFAEQGRRELEEGKTDLARSDFQRALAVDPGYEMARQGLLALEADARHARRMQDAQAAYERKDYAAARVLLDAILTERPGYEPARKLQAQIDEVDAQSPAEATLASAYKQPVTIEFRDAPLRQVFEVLSRRSGLNFLFDKDVKTDQRTSIFLKNSTVEAAIDSLLLTNQLEQRVMDGNTILIYPNVAAKQKEYQQMVVKTFYLANAEAKSVANTLKTILKSRDVVVDEKLNLVIVRDSAEAVRLAEKLVALQDVPEAEVMLEVEILEVNRSRLTELGVSWPGKVTLAPLETAEGGPLTLAGLHSLNSYNTGVSGVSAVVNANRTVGDTNLLANPRIRVRNKEKAKVLIGEKVPNITTTVSPGSGGFASESVNYVDVGLTLNVEPTIYLNNEVGIRIALEVSNIVDKQTTKSGTVAYQIGTRQASTFLQLHDGENQVLAGLINNEERSSGSHVPGLGDVPILGRLFGTRSDDSQKTEIVLSITPHLVRAVQRPAASASEFVAGTETSFRRRPDPLPVRVERPAPRPGQTGNVGSAVRPEANTGVPNLPPQTPVSVSPPPAPAAGQAAVPTAPMPGTPSTTVPVPLPPSISVVNPQTPAESNHTKGQAQKQ
ncbi:MAG TPA: secretin N-terminal domain-containing protein [Telluria sp.]|nr:secretin N-terminal domain-containing protein [Telluria sp.]